MTFHQNQPKQTLYVDQGLAFEEAFAQFIQYGRLHGRSKKTIEMYEWVCGHVRNYYGLILLSDLTTSNLRDLFANLYDRKWKPTSISIVHRVLNAFFNWSIKDCLTDENPLDGVPRPKTPKVFPFMMDDLRIQELLKESQKSCKTGKRNYLILLLFLDCGLRLNELIEIRLSQVSLSRRTIKVNGKASKERIVFMGISTTKAMKKWLKTRLSKPTLLDHLFIDQKGEPLKARWVQEIVARLGRKSGLNERLSPHRLRHVSATQAVKNGIDAFSLQRLYGWENIETAMRYVNAASCDIQAAHAKASPVDHLLR